MMLLQAFDLDLPYIAYDDVINELMEQKKLSYNEATQYDYKVNWKEKRQKFRLETRCITAMFERLFEKFETKDCWKIVVECVSNIQQKRILDLSGVFTVQVQFSYDDFTNATEKVKKQLTLDLLMQGIYIVAKEKEWNTKPFEVVKSKICELDFENEWYWKKPVKNSEKTFSAEVLCKHSIKSMDIFIIVRDKEKNIISSQKIISELPDEFAYAKHLGKIEWLSEHEVALINKKSDKQWSVNVS